MHELNKNDETAQIFSQDFFCYIRDWKVFNVRCCSCCLLTVIIAYLSIFFHKNRFSATNIDNSDIYNTGAIRGKESQGPMVTKGRSNPLTLLFLLETKSWM